MKLIAHPCIQMHIQDAADSAQAARDKERESLQAEIARLRASIQIDQDVANSAASAATAIAVSANVELEAQVANLKSSLAEAARKVQHAEAAGKDAAQNAHLLSARMEKALSGFDQVVVTLRAVQVAFVSRQSDSVHRDAMRASAKEAPRVSAQDSKRHAQAARDIARLTTLQNEVGSVRDAHRGVAQELVSKVEGVLRSVEEALTVEADGNREEMAEEWHVRAVVAARTAGPTGGKDGDEAIGEQLRRLRESVSHAYRGGSPATSPVKTLDHQRQAEAETEQLKRALAKCEADLADSQTARVSEVEALKAEVEAARAEALQQETDWQASKASYTAEQAALLAKKDGEVQALLRAAAARQADLSEVDACLRQHLGLDALPPAPESTPSKRTPIKVLHAQLLHDACGHVLACVRALMCGCLRAGHAGHGCGTGAARGRGSAADQLPRAAEQTACPQSAPTGAFRPAKGPFGPAAGVRGASPRQDHAAARSGSSAAEV